MKNIISKNTVLIGKFHGFLESLEVAGRLIIKDQSETKIENLVLSGGGLIELKLLVSDHVYIDGIFKGNVKAKKRVILEKNCQFFGNIESPEVITREGAIFYGNFFLSKENINVHATQKKINDQINKIKTDSIFKKIQH